MPKRRIGGKVCAVVELCPNLVIMKIAQCQAGKMVILDRLECFFDLEREIDATGQLSHASVQELASILTGYQRVMADYGVEKSRIFATELLKGAANYPYVIGQLETRCGLQLEVMPDETEKTILYWQMQKALADRDLDQGDKYLYAVPGTSSMGLAIQMAKRQRTRQNVPITQFEVMQTRAELEDDTEDIWQVMDEYLEICLAGLSSYGFKKSVKALAFSDSELDTLARLCGTEVQNGACEIPRDAFLTVSDQMVKLTCEEAAGEFGLSPKQAPSVYASMLIYAKLARISSAPTLIGVYGSLMDAVLEQMLLKPERNEFDSFLYEDALGCARNFAKKCHCRMEHAELVHEFATKLFDKSKRFHGMGPQERLYLQLACLLHDCGYFANVASHVECSGQLISAFSLAGLDESQTGLIAQIQGEAPADLPVMRLRVLFRLADALDVCRKQKLQDLSVRVEADRIVVTVICDDVLYLEKRAFREAADEFFTVYGVQPVLHVKSALL